MSDSKLKRHVTKVHKNLCHKSVNQMTTLFHLAGHLNSRVKKIISDVVDCCSICKKFKKTPPRPKVALSKASSTNEVISLDLKEKRELGKHILYICDEFCGYIAAKVVPNKSPEKVMEAFHQRWVREGPGIPRKGIFTDNGGEFRNEKMKELASKYGIRMNFTAAHSPWSNGRNERNHYTCDRTIEKLMEADSSLTLEDALSHAVHSHNLQINKTGFSPIQLMFGKQSVIPGVFDGTPATMEPIVESDVYRK